MQKWLWVGAGVLVVVAAAWFLFFRAAPVTNYPSLGTEIVALGDSLVYGTGSTPGNDFVSLLSQRVGRPIVNLGKPGDTTADGLTRIGELDKYKPQVVLVLLGGNDRLRQVPRSEVFANLAKIIENIHARGAVVLLLGIRGGVLGDPYAAEFRTLESVYGTAYVPDVLGGIFGDQRYMADTVHPNDAGYAAIAGRVAPVLRSLLQ